MRGHSCNAIQSDNIQDTEDAVFQLLGVQSYHVHDGFLKDFEANVTLDSEPYATDLSLCEESLLSLLRSNDVSPGSIDDYKTAWDIFT